MLGTKHRGSYTIGKESTFEPHPQHLVGSLYENGQLSSTSAYLGPLRFIFYNSLCSAVCGFNNHNQPIRETSSHSMQKDIPHQGWIAEHGLDSLNSFHQPLAIIWTSCKALWNMMLSKWKQPLFRHEHLKVKRSKWRK